MAIIYRPLGKSYLDKSEWPELMRKFEGNIPVPYDDCAPNKHLPTIGIGVNLTQRNYLARVLQELGVFTASDATAPPGETTQQRNARYNNIVNEFMGIIRNHTPLSRNANIYNAGTSPSEVALQNALNAKLQFYLNDQTKTAEFKLVNDQPYTVKIAIVQGFTIGPIVDQGKQKRLDDLLLAKSINIDHNTVEYKILMGH